VSRNYNLLQHDDKPFYGYLGALCHPPSSIKWYKFDPKTKKGKELEHQKNVKNVSMHQENDKKDKKNHQFWLLLTSFNTISNVLNFLGVVYGVSHHSLTHILLTLPSSTAYEPSWMSPSFNQAYFYKACVKDEHLRVKSLLWIITTLA
jgi:hypothetical protein